MKGIPRSLLIIAFILVVLSVAAWMFKDRWKTESKDDSVGMVAVVELRDIESSLLLTGEVTPDVQVDVKPEVGGKIKDLHVEVGQTVKKGTVLATIDDTDLLNEKASAETTIDGAKVAVEKARGNYERAEALYKQKLISRESFVNLQADFNIAKNSLEKADRSLQTVSDKLAKTKVLAPSDGTVLSMPVVEGQVVVAAASVNSGTTLMTFADLSRLLIKSHVNQVDAPRLSTGLPVEVNMSETGQDPVKAHIDFIAPLATVKNNIKGFEVHAEIEDNDGRMKPGMSVSMNVPVGRADKAVSVPVTAVFRDRKENVVYVRNGDSTEKRKVVLGVTDMSFAEVKSGLKEGEKIMLAEPSGSPTKS